MGRNLNQVTVVIFSKDRINSLRKVLNYWEENGINTLVLDGSREPDTAIQRLQRCKYIHSHSGLKERMSMASNLIETPFSILCSDDEVFLPSALEKMTVSITNDHEIVSIGGACISVWKYGPTILSSWPYKKTLNLQILDSSPLVRFRKTSVNGSALVRFMNYNLNRSELLKEILICQARKSIQISEVTSIFYTLLRGKVVYIPQVYWVRNWNKISISNEEVDRNFSIGQPGSAADIQEEVISLLDEFKKEMKLAEISSEGDIAEILNILGLLEKAATNKSPINPFKITINNLMWIRWLKYVTLFKGFEEKFQNLKIESTLEAFMNSSVSFNENELRKAAKLVSRCS